LGCGAPPYPPTTAKSTARDARYPAHWWTPVAKEGAPSWEILPQEAGPGEVILSKRHELGLLSNFAPTPFTFHGRKYASLEGFWQMMLYPEDANDARATFPGLAWQHTREQVSQMAAFEAKKAGSLAEDNMKQMGIGWVTFEGRRFDYRPATTGEHYRLIVEATKEKVRQNPEVRRVLWRRTLSPDDFSALISTNRTHLPRLTDRFCRKCERILIARIIRRIYDN
jgi:hypothetical protein